MAPKRRPGKRPATGNAAAAAGGGRSGGRSLWSSPLLALAAAVAAAVAVAFVATRGRGGGATVAGNGAPHAAHDDDLLHIEASFLTEKECDRLVGLFSDKQAMNPIEGRVGYVDERGGKAVWGVGGGRRTVAIRWGGGKGAVGGSDREIRARAGNCECETARQRYGQRLRQR